MNTLVFIIIFVIEAVILWQYCHHFLNAKIDRYTNVAVLSIIYGFLFYGYLMELSLVNLLFAYFLCTLYIYFFYEVDILQTFFYVTIFSGIMSFSNLLVLYLLPGFSSGVFSITYTSNQILILSIGSKMLSFFMVRIVIYCSSFHNKDTLMKINESFLLIVAPLFSFVILITILMVAGERSLPSNIAILLLISSILLLALNFIIFNIYYYVSDKNREHLKMQLQLQHDEDMISYHKGLIQQDDSQKIMLHDINKHLQTLQYLCQNFKTEEATVYVDDLMKLDAFAPSVKLCNHELLNSILYHYKRAAIEKNVEFSTDIRNATIDFLQDSEITSLFCNLLDNAIEATSGNQNEYIELNVTKDNSAESSCITLINSCASNPFDKKTNLLTTKKANAAEHGFGIKSIEKIVSKYDGIINMHYDSTDGTFHTVILFHILALDTSKNI